MFLSALASLRANKLRSVLTMLGIFIGVASIISIVAVGAGGQQAIVSTLESPRLQRTIQIVPRELVVQGVPQPGQILRFETSDFQVARSFSGVSDVYYTLYGQTNAVVGSKVVAASIQAGPSYLNDIARFTVVEGRMYNDVDVISHRPVVLVSTTLATKLFGTGNPVGQTIQLNHQAVQVIGVAVPTQLSFNSVLYGSDNLYMPDTTCRDLFPQWDITEMDIEVQSGVNKDALAKRIVMALNIHAHRADAFVDSAGFMQGIAKTVGTVTAILTAVIGAVAGIALVVGGVGVMNIMLVSVTERTQEIGIRMSLGATKRTILLQFLTESVMLTSIGGLAGILAGVAASIAVRVFTPLPTSVSWWAIVGSFIFSALVGVICGIYPANKAARQSPIEALRHD